MTNFSALLAIAGIDTIIKAGPPDRARGCWAQNMTAPVSSKQNAYTPQLANLRPLSHTSRGCIVLFVHLLYKPAELGAADLCPTFADNSKQ